MANSARSPIFYDLDNTGYYVDPASTTNLYQLNVRAGGAYTNLTDVNADTAPVRILETGTGTGSERWIPMIAGTSTSSSGYRQHTVFGSVRSTVWGSAFIGVGGNDSYPTVAYRFDYVGNATAPSSWRAPIFYDSDDTSYYVDGNNYSSFYGVAVRGDKSSTSTGNQLFLWDGGNTTTSAIGFKANGGNFANPTGNGDGYNTYFTMDTDGRGWVFRRGTGGTDFTSANNSGWILNNGVWQANASMRAPIFYDSDNTGYYGDFTSTSNLNGLTVNAGLVAPRHYVNRSAGANSGINWYSSSYTSWTDYMSNPGQTGCGPTGNITAPSGALATSWSLRRFIENVAGYGWTWESGTSSGQPSVVAEIRSSDGMAQFNGGVRSPIFYDSDNTGYYVDPASTSSITSLNFGGVLALTSSGATVGNSTGARLLENYGPVWNLSNSSTWHFQVINGSILTGFNASGGNFGGGNIVATGNITAYYSDERLKTQLGNIENALDKVCSLNGFTYINNEIAKSYHFDKEGPQAGVSAQEVQKVLPEVVSLAPFDMQGVPETGEIISKSGENYLTVDYARMIPLLIEAIKEQQKQIEELKTEMQTMKNNIIT
jgi:hypothetical protein